MTQQIPCSNTNVDQTIDREQFNKIVEAILAGKYSWACFLLLRCTGYNPLNYIPYRTYNRIVKENSQTNLLYERQTHKSNSDRQCSKINSHGTTSRKNLSQITDLDYLETVGEDDKRVQQVRGGYFFSHYLERLLFSLQE